METTLQTEAPESKNCTEASTCERAQGGSCYSPRFDIVETADELTLYGDLPGVKPEDLEVRFENQELVIHGKASARVEGKPRYWEREYGVGDFYRAFKISEGVDASRINAELKNGVLTLHLPKPEAIKPRRIQVNAV